MRGCDIFCDERLSLHVVYAPDPKAASHLLGALRHPPRLPTQPPMVPGHDRWLGGEAGRVAVPKIRASGFCHGHKFVTGIKS